MSSKLGTPPENAEGAPATSNEPGDTAQPEAQVSAADASERDRDDLHFEVWLPAPAQFYRLDGATFLVNRANIAIEHEGRFLQDGMLSAHGEPCRSFTALAGSWPDATWALTDSAPGEEPKPALVRWRKNRWVLQQDLRSYRASLAQWTQGFGLLMTSPRKTTRPSYRLAVLGKGKAPQPARAPAGRPCATALVQPKMLLTSARGDVAVLGEACGTSASLVEHWTPGSSQSTLHPFPDGVHVETLTFTEEGVLWAAGSQVASSQEAGKSQQADNTSEASSSPPPGYVAQLEGERWIEKLAPSQTVLSLAVTPSGALWAVVDASDSTPGDRNKAVWRMAGTNDTWHSTKLPPTKRDQPIAASPLWIEAQDDSVWLRTERELMINTGSSSELPQSPIGLSGSCYQPVTNAAPYTYRKVTGPAPLQVRLHGNLVGPDCPHFFLVESTSEPRSELWEQALQPLGPAHIPRLYLIPQVSFELGRYHFGLSVRDLQIEWEVKKFLNREFPQARELCANPHGIPLEWVTNNTEILQSRWRRP